MHHRRESFNALEVRSLHFNVQVYWLWFIGKETQVLYDNELSDKISTNAVKRRAGKEPLKSWFTRRWNQLAEMGRFQSEPTLDREMRPVQPGILFNQPAASPTKTWSRTISRANELQPFADALALNPNALEEAANTPATTLDGFDPDEMDEGFKTVPAWNQVVAPNSSPRKRKNLPEDGESDASLTDREDDMFETGPTSEQMQHLHTTRFDSEAMSDSQDSKTSRFSNRSLGKSITAPASFFNTGVDF